MENNQEKNIDIKDLKKTFRKRNFYNVGDSGKVFLYAVIIPFLVALIFSYIGYAIAKGVGITFEEGENFLETLYNNHLWFTIPYALISQISFICIFFIYNKVRHISLKAVKVKFRKVNPVVTVMSILFGIIFVLGLFGLVEGCFGTLFDMWGIPSNTNMIPLDNFGWYVFYLFFFALIPAIVEELIFRGVIFNGLKRGIGSLWAIILSSLIFALVHQNLNQFIYPLIMGAVFSILMNKTNNLIYPILMHFFNNLTTITIQYLQNIDAINLNLQVNAVYVVVSLVLAIVVGVLFFLFYFFYLRKKDFSETETEEEDFVGKNPILISKLPLSMYAGLIVSTIFLVINSIPL